MIDPRDPGAISPGQRAELPTPPAIASGELVERVDTPLDDTQVRDALRVGHLIAFGAPPSDERLAIAWAQICEETARGKAIHNFNFGNIDRTLDWPGDVFPLVADELLDQVRAAHRKMLRSYASAAAGAAGFWLYLAEHHATALEAFHGTGLAAAAALKHSGYFTGLLAEYAPAMASLVREYFRRWPGSTP
ncbi:MAG: hypothetical protein ABJE95_19545 [Byssovorax sp.]